MTGFYPCEASINAINSDAFCVYSGDNARVKAFKLSAEFCHLRRRYARQARCRLTISAGSAKSARATSGNISGEYRQCRYAGVSGARY
ncbi:hypothetical protein R446_07905 [Salmonella enterica subsp. enterica serovar Tennessee]|nr:hypothetical protein R447_11225 [Salmonella enterica subsp. enterica serovar Tennessee]KZG19038.1 hypothetical protein R446_07905 [Salmonella enterica subsp. enterica serovar Tennessee]